jgi:LuxR family maltose regulon positive regulatory protein
MDIDHAQPRGLASPHEPHSGRTRLPSLHVARERLVVELVDAPLGLIEGAAGYGKSVLASELQHTLGIACAWVPLGPPDADPSVLVASVRRAIGTAKLSDLFATLVNGEPESWPDRFVDALTSFGEPLLIVLDDAHHLGGGEAATLVARMAKVLAPPLRLVATVRRLQPALEPLRDIGASSIAAHDLAFNEEETADLVRETLGREPFGGEVASLLEVTGGWASALLLALRRANGEPVSSRGQFPPDVFSSPR